MVTVCWSVKGGVGVSVVSAALALSLREQTDDPTLLVDLGGDMANVLGHVSASQHLTRPGVGEWLASDVPAASLGGLVDEVTPQLSLLGRGSSSAHLPAPRVPELLDWLRAWPGGVVVNLGSSTDLRRPMLGGGVQSLLVLRLCYLGARAAFDEDRPDGLIVVEEPGRALTSADLASALDVPVVARVPYDPTISRAVDAGLLAARVPRLLGRALRGIVAHELVATR